MMSKLPQSHQGKEKSGFWLLNPASKIESLLLTLFFLFLPTQLGKHFWPDFSIVAGIRIDYLSPTLYVTDIIIGLLFIVSASHLLQNSKFKVQNAKLQFISKKFFAFCLLVGIFFTANAFFAARPLLSLYGLVKLAEYTFLAFYLANTIKQKIQLQRIALFFSVSMLFESVLAIAQYVQQGSLNGIFYFFGERMFTGVTPGIANVSIAGDLILRPYATFPHPNVLAGYLLVALLFVWFFLRNASLKSIQAIAATSLVIGSIALLLTFSRIAIALWVVLMVLLLFKMLRLKVQNTKQKIIASCFLIVALGFVMVLPLSQELITRFAQTSFSEEAFSERAILLNAAFTLFQQHPFIGVGLDNFLPSLAPLQTPMPLNLYLQPVHNIFLLILTEGGIIGLWLFLELLFVSLQEIWRNTKEVRNFLLLSLAVIIITGLFDHYWLTLQQGQLLFATILGLSWIRKTA